MAPLPQAPVFVLLLERDQAVFVDEHNLGNPVALRAELSPAILMLERTAHGTFRVHRSPSSSCYWSVTKPSSWMSTTWQKPHLRWSSLRTTRS